jgi:hypothetical protein
LDDGAAAAATAPTVKAEKKVHLFTRCVSLLSSLLHTLHCTGAATILKALEGGCRRLHHMRAPPPTPH